MSSMGFSESGWSRCGGELKDYCMQPGPAQEGREVGDEAGCAWPGTVCTITEGQSCIFCLVRPRSPRLPQGSGRGSHQSTPKVCASEKPSWGTVWMRWKGRLESPKILPATGSTHDTHWFPNFRTCLILPMQTWVHTPATMAMWSWAEALQLHGWN